MATPTNSKPQLPVIVRHDTDGARVGLTLVIAAVVSAVFHGALLGGLLLISISTASAEHGKEKEDKSLPDDVVQMGPSETPKEVTDTSTPEDLDPSRQDFATDINYPLDRFAEFSNPGMVDVTQQVGIQNGDPTASPTNLPLPLGSGGFGQGGALDDP